jgi:vancomycin permeability regulator SanA
MWLKIKKFTLYSSISSILIVVSTALFIFMNYDHEFIEKTDCAVVFGAAVWRDNIPSHALYDRTISGINLYENNQVDCLIFSGGPSKYGAHEADVMHQMATKLGIPDQDILLDHEGINTLKTLKNLPTDKNFVFVSNDFHLARIKLLAWKLEIQDSAFHAATYHYGRYAKELFFFGREMVGLWYYGLRVI